MLGLAGSYKAGQLDTDRCLSDAHSQAVRELATLQTRLEGVINTMFSTISGLSDVIAYQGGISDELFTALAKRVIKGNPQIRNVMAAPGDVITLLYPLQGNEKVFGLRYATIPEQYASIKKAKQSACSVLSGPHDLVQGGRGLIARVPVFTDRRRPQGATPRYWGVVSSLVHTDTLIRQSGITTTPTLDVVVRRSAEKNTEHSVIWGNPSLLSEQPVSMEFQVFGERWQLAAVPKNGWPQLHPIGSPIFGIGMINSLLVAAFIGWLITLPHQERLRNEALQREITERRRVEEKLRLSEQKYATVFQMVPDAIGITRKSDGCFLEVNPGFFRITGWRHEEVIGLNSIELNIWSTATRDAIVQEMKRKDIVDNYPLSLCTRSGEFRHGLISLVPITVRDEECLLFVGRDITELKSAERVLENERTRFINLVDSVDGIVWESDATTFTFSYVSRQAERLLGYPVEEWYGEQFWYEHLHPEDRDRVSTYAQTCAAGGGQHELEYRFVARDGHTVWIQDFITVVNEEGVPRWRRGIMVDITRKREDEKERERLEKQLRQVQRIEAIGRLAGGIAHDFNNKLTVILGYAELLKTSAGAGDRKYNQLDQIIQAATQSKEITRQLLTFSRQEVISPQLLDLNALVMSVRKGMGRLIGEDIRFETRLADQLWAIYMDPTQMDQVIMNLIVNARDAMTNGGRLIVETGNVELNGLFVRSYPEIKAGSYVQLTVSDTGCGISAEVQQHIFEPFYTTKETGKGTGLGLATVYGIVRQNHG
ncbi:MAG: PAS domain S-box protein, partial [Desulfobulbus sp.]|nr:PAS domain S-box protein [Desulfobulbus sp.]